MSQINTISYLKGKNNTYEIVDLSARADIQLLKNNSGSIESSSASAIIQQFPELSSGTSLVDSDLSVKYTIINTINNFKIIDQFKNIIQPMNLLININEKNTRIQFSSDFSDNTSLWRTIIYGTLSSQVYNNATQLDDLQDIQVDYNSVEQDSMLMYDVSQNKWVPKIIPAQSQIISFPPISTGISTLNQNMNIKYTIINTLNSIDIIDYNKNLIDPLNKILDIQNGLTRLQFSSDFLEDVSNWKIIIHGNSQSQVYNNATQLDDLQDVVITNPILGDSLLFNGSKWIPSSLTINTSNIKTQLSALTDVDVSESISGEFLKFNGQKWISDSNQLSGIYDPQLQTLQIKGTSLSFIQQNILDTIIPIENNGILYPNCHYQITMTQNTTLNAYDGVSGKIGAAQLLINPGSYTFTPGTNLTLVNNLIPNKINYCTINWFGIIARMYVIDTFEA